MKARKLKNGTWTISGISTKQLESLNKVLNFAKYSEMTYCHYIDEQRKMIDKLRSQDGVLGDVEFLRFFVDSLLK